MKKLHVALSTHELDSTIRDYTKRIGTSPSVVVKDEYALWRTASANISVRVDKHSQAGSLRHLGWEDPEATELTETVDINGMTWERFNATHQADEIKEIWPDTCYQPESL